MIDGEGVHTMTNEDLLIMMYESCAGINFSEQTEAIQEQIREDIRKDVEYLDSREREDRMIGGSLGR